MSTGKRLAKRSIIGTRVCAPGPDGLWYSGVIQDVKIPPNKNSHTENNNCINLTPDTRYIVRFDLKTYYQQQQKQKQAIIIANNLKNSQQIIDDDQEMMDATTVTATRITNVIHHQQQQQQQQQQFIHHPQQIQHHHSIQSRPDIMLSPAQSIRRNAMIKEFRDSDLIGPGFRSMIGVQLHPGQRVFLTYNGREISGEIKSHDLQKDEVWVKITPIGYEEPLELKKRLEEVRLLESRRSARLADQDRDTDFARLADMAGDRRRTSHSIDVPLALTQHNSRKRRPSYSQEYRESFITQFRDDDQMDACNAALVLMSLSCSPRSPRQWNTVLGSSPGSSSASWSSSGTSSPPLSDDGTNLNNDHRTTNPRIRTASLSTSDEGIVMDYSDDAPRKRRAHGPIFQCTWKGCGVVEATVAKIELHVRNAHLGPKKPRHSFDDDGAFSDSDHEEEFYYTEIEEEDEGKAPSPPSPPTLSHRDMARPPHEDPEYQRQIVGNFRQGLLALSQNSNSAKLSHHSHLSNNNNNNNISNNNSNNAGPINIPTSPLAHHNYTWHSPVSPVKHARWSPRPSTSSAPYPSPTYIHHQYNNNNNNNNNNTINHPLPPQQQNGLTVPQNAANLATLSHSATTTTQNHHVTQVPVTINHPQNSVLHNSHHQVHHQQQQQQQQQHHPHLQQQHLPTPPQPHTVVIPAVAPAAAAAAVAGSQIISGGGTITTPQPAAVTQTVATNHRSPQSPNRRTRGDNKKCRKVYGMDNKDQWCTQCKWKKACSRFGD